LRKVARAQVGSGNADLRVRAITTPVTDQYDDHLIARTSATGELRERALDVDLRRCPAIVRLRRHTVLAEPLNLGVRNTESFGRCVSERLSELGKRLRVLLFATEPANDDQMCLSDERLAGSTEREQHEQREQPTQRGPRPVPVCRSP